MKYGSVCSGIEAATVAWQGLGWRPQWFSEIAKFPSAVLAHHYPHVPNTGDMTKFNEWGITSGAIDILVGGTPCQSFSVAGLRKGLADPRGNLMLTYLALADRARPRWLVWENVPGVLSSSRGRDFGTFLGALAELGYGWAYRVLDAQYFGVAQRRRRVFVVGYLGDWRRAAAVLFERHSLSGDPAPSRETRQGAAADAAPSPAGCWWDGGQVSQTLDAVLSKGQTMPEKNRFPAVLQPICAHGTQDPDAVATQRVVVGTDCYDGAVTGDVACTIGAPGSSVNASGPTVMQAMAVRRLTPRECERLQGFPDDYTLVSVRSKPAADAPRYKALGNSMAVPVMQWIGERIHFEEHGFL